ncbi:MAG: glutamate--tRNA ligase [Gammaproteobacteria bacterium]|nr:glutamate--tRNA ligase [Gammaproteobacteria bacterium]
MTVRTRFAPSPTGYLHIGGARTALFSWLYARKHGGRFILRIEDTDLERSTAESVNAILEGMTWLGLDYDEGPFYQTQRFDRYKEVIQQLLQQDKAYLCYCSKAELEAMRAAQMARKEKPRYDGRCRHRQGPPLVGAQPVVRFKNPLDGQVLINDVVRGKVVIANGELDDLIIARSDGTPTYNFTVVVDDYDMKITHVIRGDDHLNNTPRQINILKAMGAPIPVYAHLPMILAEDGAKLSKRVHGESVSVIQYREEGYLPEALLNYLVRLGWSHGDQEIFTLDTLVQLFEINDINHSASSINKSKLLWLNQHYIKHATPEHIARHLSYHFTKWNIDPSQGPDLLEVIKVQQERCKTLVEIVQASACFYRPLSHYNPEDVSKYFNADVVPMFLALREKLQALTPWQKEPIHQVIKDTAETLGLKMGKLAQPLRVAVTGGSVSPSIDVTLYLLGRDTTLQRLDQALNYMAVGA